MKLISFNINGIRARLHQLEAILKKHKPFVMGLQEIKCPDDQFPEQAVLDMGYKVYYFGQKSHYGVALVCQEAPTEIRRGFDGDTEDAQKRMIGASWLLPSGQHLHVLNGYFPQGDNRKHETKFPAKRAFYEDLQSCLEGDYKPDDLLMVMGDFNIAPDDKDIGIGEVNAKRWLKQGKASFLPEEREWYARMEGFGLSDAYRKIHPSESDRFSWFDYRSRGFEAEPKRGLRIDHLMVTAPLLAKVTDSDVDYEIRGMEKPSDHAPVWASFAL